MSFREKKLHCLDLCPIFRAKTRAGGRNCGDEAVLACAVIVLSGGVQGHGSRCGDIVGAGKRACHQVSWLVSAAGQQPRAEPQLG